MKKDNFILFIYLFYFIYIFIYINIMATSFSLADGGTIGSGNATWTFDDSNNDISTTVNVGIGTTAPVTKLHVDGALMLGDILNVPSASPWTSANSQLILAGDHNTDYNHGNKCKLLITGYDNENLSGEVYPIYCEDENGRCDFHIKSAPAGEYYSTAFFGTKSKVGIRTDAPSAPLHVVAGSDTSPANNSVYIYNPTNSANQHAILSVRVAGSSGGDPFVSYDVANESGWSTGIDNSDGNKFKIAQSWSSLTSSTRMTISGGNVGIGTTTPGAMLHVNGGEVQFQRYDYTSHFNYSTNGDAYIRSGRSAGKIILQDTGGNVGIGTSTPNYRLHVVGHAGYYVNVNLRAYHHGNGSWAFYGSGNWNPSSTHPVGLRVDEGIIAQRMYFHSDERIKKDIVDVEDDQALVKLRQLKPKKYKYKDGFINGENEVYGFIAQEVLSIIPYSCTLERDYIPNILLSAKISSVEEDSCILTTLEEHQLQEADIISCRDSKYQPIDDITVEIIDSKTIKINKTFTEEQTTFIDEDDFQEENVIFIYGKKVEDFHNLNKETIWTVATAALQEVDRQLQAEKVKVANLTARLEAIEAHLGL